jgi:superfamily II DNA/RNA helicase
VCPIPKKVAALRAIIKAEYTRAKPGIAEDFHALVSVLHAYVRFSCKALTPCSWNLSSCKQVFIEPNRPVDMIAAALEADLAALTNSLGLRNTSPYVSVLSEDLDLDARARQVERFRTGECPVLITSDLCSRGIDVPSITHVIQFDLPSNADKYLHRYDCFRLSVSLTSV